MSKLRHPTLSAWQRNHEDGSYAAEIRGWNLSVRWVPEKSGERRGFLWEATGPNGEKMASPSVTEEMEVAMATAEECVAPDPEKHETKIID
ncbi:hypothetical protein [Chondromyces crocatus]|uniref:Uncharacterized protein n=1 Tax=Chondromyces crocatus TaxID=52 RepID=A0A0K1EFT4_CHOCO|nr:hypothetical protein [Chondromyces crocatus]AKT39552.1 uncharacterized protein CMC5_036990 [Chondromyces crocatus]